MGLKKLLHDFKLFQCFDEVKKNTIMFPQSCFTSKSIFKYCRGLKFVPLRFKTLLILQSVNKVKLNLSSCFFSEPDSSKAKIFRN